MEEFVDHYERLNLEMGASNKAIKNAYKRLALKWHPDKHAESEKVYAEFMFQRIHTSFLLLSDPSSRSTFDQEMSRRMAQKVRVNEMESRRKQMVEELNKRESTLTNATSVAAQRAAEERNVAENTRKLIKKMNEQRRAERAAEVPISAPPASRQRCAAPPAAPSSLEDHENEIFAMLQNLPRRQTPQ
eukprot:gnl/Spiro4/21802_TR10691_c0_g1_i1.p1 gnl/Spiro4/21802_TR10691_c0_g1~~gnl/Spiro4/21802_TR10691_c0_g1_i1.p1  ORF type:complete len:188 (-),score=46.44 gnl/Spiro4/21802_TR10691_c0_g1_i1:106-669(-)